MTRTEIADSLAIGARVFVRKARREGSTAIISDDLIHSIAETRGIAGDRYSMRTVWTLVRRYCKDAGESDMIASDRRKR